MIARVGTGGGATVYLASASGAAGVSKLLVVKVLRADLADDPAFVAMFLDEARLSTRLNHPNIVQVIEVGRENGLYFIVMEYLEGKPLARLSGADIPGIGRDVLVHLIAESLDGLHYAHELADYDGTPLGVVHRDFSPQNIFVTYDGHAKLLDFGVAKMLTSSVKTEIDVLKGKPRYMSPEQMSSAEVDRRADIFSAGVVLWEAVSGLRMWAGKNDMAVMWAVGGGRIPKIESVAPDAPAELIRIVNRALSPARELRYPTALALQEDLEAYLRRAGDAVRPRDIGRMLAGHFVADRAQIGMAVETQLKSLTAPSGRFQLVSIPDIETGVLGASESSESRAHPLSNPPTIIPNEVLPAVGSRRSWWLLGAAAIVAAGFGSAYRMMSGVEVLGGLRERASAALGEPTDTDPTAPPPAAPSATPPIEATRQGSSSHQAPLGEVQGPVVKLTFRASPPEAKLFLDGKALEGNPFSGEFPKTSVTHVLRAEAPSYSTLAEPLTFARDAALDLTLQKADARPARPAASPPAPLAPAPVAPAAVAPPPKAPAPAPGKKAPVDSNNPYDE